MSTLWWIISVVAGLAVVSSLAIPLARRWERRRVSDAVRLFKLRREVLEARFLDRARQLGKPRGLRWIDCEWLPSVTFARDKSTGLITAFVGINIRFEAIEGGGMEDVAAVSTVRDAAALFHFQNGNWGTGGRALFNMNPGDAVAKLVSQYDPLPTELTAV